MGALVAKVETPWATARDHDAIILNMDRILRGAWIDAAHVRRRMIAHSIVASGWRQSCQNFNVWKVKRGGWGGDWYVSSTTEEIGGKVVVEHGTKWRSYASYADAINDYPIWHSSRYRRACDLLRDAGAADSDFWAELGKAGYYSDTHNMKPANFGSICARVRRTLAGETFTEASWGELFDLWLRATIARGVGAA